MSVERELLDALLGGGAEPGAEDLERTTLMGQLRSELLPFAPQGPLPDPTPAEGPDPYGNPDPEWLRIDWREHLREAEVPGAEGSKTRVNYVEMGAGPPLVFVHGLGGCWQNWLENIPRFAADHRVLALDLPGFGNSPIPGWAISIEAYGRLLHDFCEALGVDRCALVGNSMGGFISAEAAWTEPQRFTRLALVSAAGVSSARVRREPAEALARMTVATTPVALKLEERALRRSRARWLTFRGIFHDPLALRTELLYEFFHNGTGRPGFLPALQTLLGYDILDRLRDVEVPTLIVWGRNDMVVPAGDARAFGERLRNSTTVIFDETGHCPMAERPVRFNRVLETFLSA